MPPVPAMPATRGRVTLTLDEAPWGDPNGKPLDARHLSRELARYGARPVTFETTEGSAKGYVTYPPPEHEPKPGSPTPGPGIYPQPSVIADQSPPARLPTHR
jgi:hypothetical protein